MGDGHRPSSFSGDHSDSPPQLWTGAAKRHENNKRKMIIEKEKEEVEEIGNAFKVSGINGGSYHLEDIVVTPDQHNKSTKSSVAIIKNISPSDDDDEEVAENTKPIGNVVCISCIGGSRRNHYNGFEADGVSYELDDTVLIVPDEHHMKPSVATIKDISATQDGRITVNGQRFYRLEVAENENGEKWTSSESRELFYSFDKTEFPADSVMHKCCVLFIPPNKEIPRSKDQPGFIVRKIYDSKYKELTELVDESYDDCKQHEINLLVERTIAKFPVLAVRKAKEPLKL